MAFGKAAVGLIAASAAWLSAAQFAVRNGELRIDENGVAFSGPKKPPLAWKFEDIRQLELAPERIRILTYKGIGKAYQFEGTIPVVELYPFLLARMDQRFVAAVGQTSGLPSWSVPVKHLRGLSGSEGMLSFGRDSIVYATPAKNESRTWRITDIASISSSGRFQFTITTLEKSFDFQLKKAISEARYNELWLQIEKTNGRIQ
jgi:hypothetical protein